MNLLLLLSALLTGLTGAMAGERVAQPRHIESSTPAAQVAASAAVEIVAVEMVRQAWANTRKADARQNAGPVVQAMAVLSRALIRGERRQE